MQGGAARGDVVPAPPTRVVQEKAQAHRAPRLATIGQAERNTGAGFGLASDRARMQRAVDFNDASFARASSATQGPAAPSPVQLGHAYWKEAVDAARKERGKSKRGTFSTSPRDTNPASAERFPAHDAMYDTDGLWRIGATEHFAVLHVQPSPRQRPHTAAAGSENTSTRRTKAPSGNGDSLRYSRRQVRNLKRQTSAAARREDLARRQAEGHTCASGATGQSAPGGVAGNASSGRGAAGYYGALLAAREDATTAVAHHGAGDGGSDHPPGTADPHDDNNEQHQDSRAAHRGGATSPAPPAVWSMSRAPRFTNCRDAASAATLAASESDTKAPLRPNLDVAVRRHVPGPAMVPQVPSSTFDEHRSARNGSAPPRFQRYRANSKYPVNLRSCVHSKLAPASAALPRSGAAGGVAGITRYRSTPTA